MIAAGIDRFRDLAQPGGMPGSQAGSQQAAKKGIAGRARSVMRSTPGPNINPRQRGKLAGPGVPGIGAPQPMPGPGLGSLSGSLRDLAGPRFGTQERGSATDAATTLNRSSPSEMMTNHMGLESQGPATAIGDLPDDHPFRAMIHTQQPGSPALQQPGGGAPVTDPNSLDRFITPENTLRNQRIGFDAREIDPQSQESTLMRMAQSIMPGLQEQFDQQARGVANRTAAMGRTGSGLVDRNFADLQNHQERALHGIMGQLSAQAAGQDIQNDMSAQGMNQQLDLTRLAHLQNERGREDQLARQAMGDRATQMGFLGQGFASNPTGALNQAAGMHLGGAGQFGANAGMINQQLAGAAGAGAQQPGGIGGIVERVLGGIGGPQLPSTPPINPGASIPGMNTTPVAPRNFDPLSIIQ